MEKQLSLSFLIFLITLASGAETLNAWFPPPPPLALGSSGPAVEDLQRTLNARLKPSPELAVDGDFGPNTEKAVRRFQQLKKLPITGTVDANTLRMLSPLVSAPPSVPSPDKINSEILPRKPADSLDGPPFVSCKAWAIADGRSGKTLWEFNGNQSLDMASTTKIMTAYLVFSLAARSPEILDETVIFSERADKTGGSTSAIRAGEQLPVKELLYGLLLPSGNDASVSLGEHFGQRLAPRGSDLAADPMALFIAAMNRQAKKLGMRHTQLANTHGLTAEGHHSSAVDLSNLAHAAMQLPLFRSYVATRQHGAVLRSADDQQRNIVWRNSNRLLPIEGYQGIKTGTTSAAGACLVSFGTRGPDSLIIVVLGSSDSDARYIDSRNLYRWAWNQRAGSAK
jgi:D-alanyl-D-alanine carboxypeptidase (penicillin-binding protein 5/6)